MQTLSILGGSDPVGLAQGGTFLPSVRRGNAVIYLACERQFFAYSLTLRIIEENMISSYSPIAGGASCVI